MRTHSYYVSVLSINPKSWKEWSRLHLLSYFLFVSNSFYCSLIKNSIKGETNDVHWQRKSYKPRVEWMSCSRRDSRPTDVSVLSSRHPNPEAICHCHPNPLAIIYLFYFFSYSPCSVSLMLARSYSAFLFILLIRLYCRVFVFCVFIFLFLYFLFLTYLYWIELSEWYHLERCRPITNR